MSAPGGLLTGIAAPLAINAGPGAGGLGGNHLVLDDSGDPQSNTVTMTGTTVSSLSGLFQHPCASGVPDHLVFDQLIEVGA